MPSSPGCDNTHGPPNTESNEKCMVAKAGRRKRPAVPTEERKRARKACVVLHSMLQTIDQCPQITNNANSIARDSIAASLVAVTS